MQPGQLWVPVNSADGMFMENICCFCKHDAAYQAGEGDSCEIAAAMHANGNNPAWIIGLDGKPFCKSFKHEGAAYRCPLTPDLFK